MDFANVTISVSTQVLVMLSLILFGYFLTKKRVLTNTGTAEISTILLNAVTPCLLIRAYHVPFDYNKLTSLLWGYLICFLVHIIYIILAKLYFKPYKDLSRKRIGEASAVFSNCGFMAIPLLESCFGVEGAFYGSAYLSMFHIFVWTVGKSSIEKVNSTVSKVTILNPGIIGVVIGLFFYFTQIKLPTFAYNTISFVADLNTPLAMIVIGNFLAKSNIMNSLKDKDVYIVSLFRLFLAPILLAFALRLFKFNDAMAISVVISAACPVAAIVPIFAKRYNCSYDYATNLTVATTLFSLITIPLICLITGKIL